MSIPPEIYSIQEWRVFGRNRFRPPFKISDSLINEARIVYVVNGKARLYAANKYHDLRNDDLIIMKSDNFINNWYKNENDELNQVIVFQLPSDFLKFLYNDQVPSWFKQQPNEAVDSILRIPNNMLICSFIENLKIYFENPIHLTEEVIKIKMKELISLLIQIDQSGQVRLMFSNLFRSSNYEFQEVIQQNLYEDLNLNDLAFLTNMSLSSFKRKFASAYNTSPNKYIINKRLEKAQNLLKSSDLGVAEIAYQCGFSDEGYFSKTFKKHFELSPSQYRG